MKLRCMYKYQERRLKLYSIMYLREWLLQLSRFQGSEESKEIPRDILLEILGYSKVYRQVIKRLINSAIEDYVKQEDLKVGKELTVEQSYEDLEETFEPGESFSFDAIIKLQEVS
ncbi:PREDICTED: uncharacterized protein LOC104704344 [Camelina sativa]|uniref:Uncharacterized protein LOC104704344 n=1 Tax=Camelina sativa TaxID=90675 RepID=A0ABM1Q8F3_CAMSA|nr:PREDICTED: uncharacterized protein LOC104704344 [Camelina sativa]